MNVHEWGASLYHDHREELTRTSRATYEFLLDEREGWLVALEVVESLLKRGALSDEERAIALDFAEAGAFSKCSGEVLEKLRQPVGV